jgi:hypothetical protein
VENEVMSGELRRNFGEWVSGLDHSLLGSWSNANIEQGTPNIEHRSEMQNTE